MDTPEDPPLVDNLYYRAWRHLQTEMANRHAMPENITTDMINEQILTWAQEMSIADLMWFLQEQNRV